MNREIVLNILHTENYIVDVDPQKNRIYARVHKVIKETPEPSQLLEKLHELKHYLSSGFTMLIDVCKEDVRVQEDVALMHDIMDLLIEGGIRRVAEIYPNSPNFLRRAEELETWAGTCIQKKMFTNHEEAEAWLNEC